MRAELQAKCLLGEFCLETPFRKVRGKGAGGRREGPTVNADAIETQRRSGVAFQSGSKWK